MKIVPDKNQILGRVAEITKTAGGLELPTSQHNTTTFMIVDAIGPDVTKYQVGQVILARSVNHIYLRDGFHRILAQETEVWAHIEETELDQFTIS